MCAREAEKGKHRAPRIDIVAIAPIPPASAKTRSNPLSEHGQKRLRGAGSALILGTPAAARAQSPPNAPVILSPSANGDLLSPFDVHLETQPMTDPDPGDTHACTDWEIWTVSPPERVWAALCITG